MKNQYIDAAIAAIDSESDAARPWLTEVCPECDVVPADDLSSDPRWLHSTYRGYVLIGCEGYFVVNPNAIGIEDPDWNDWKIPLIDPRFERAWFRVSLAGRELGSGPQVAAERIAVGVEEWLRERKVPDLNAMCIAAGVAVGLVMAEDPDALNMLEAINLEWRRNS